MLDLAFEGLGDLVEDPYLTNARRPKHRARTTITNVRQYPVM